MGRKLDVFFHVLLSREAEPLLTSLHYSVDVDGAAPDQEEIPQSVFGVIDPQIDPFILMMQEELSAVSVVSVFHYNDRASHVGQAEEELLFDLLEIAVFDFVAFGFFV